MMNAEKASTLRLLKEGMGNTVTVVETRAEDDVHEVKALLPNCPESNFLPILFLLTTLAFLEASSIDAKNEIDGWTPVDFLSFLRFESGVVKINLDQVRGRKISTQISLSPVGELIIYTHGRGMSANRWLSYVRGRRHLQDASFIAKDA